MSMLEMMLRVVRSQTNLVGEPVANIHGAVALASDTEAKVNSGSWMVAELAAITLPEIAAFHSLFLGEQAQAGTAPATNGTVVIERATPRALLARGVLKVESPITVSLNVATDGASDPFAVYVDGVLLRSGTNGLSVPIAVGAGTHSIEVVALTKRLGLQMPTAVEVRPDGDAVPTPQWNTVTTGYLDAGIGAPVVTLSWHADAIVGGWRVLRRQLSAVAPIVAISAADRAAEYSVVFAGELNALLPAYGQIYAGAALMGTVLRAQYDPDNNQTAVRVRLPSSRTAPETAWVGAAARVGAFSVIGTLQRADATATRTFQDTDVVKGQTYEYALEAWGLYNPLARSGQSDPYVIEAGDITPPGPVTGVTKQGINGRLTLRFTTPTDSDYAGVRVVLIGTVVTGTATSASGSTLTDTSKSWTTNAFAGWKARTAMGEVLAVLSNTTNQLTFTNAPQASVQGAGYSLYLDQLQMTDYGLPGSDDQLTFIPPNDDVYALCTFDRAGNMQHPLDAAQITYTAAIDNQSSNQPPSIRLRQLSMAEQAFFTIGNAGADYTDPSKWAIVEVYAEDRAQAGSAWTDVSIEARWKGGGSAFINAGNTPTDNSGIPTFPTTVTNDNARVYSDGGHRFIPLSRVSDNVWITVSAADAQGVQSDVITYTIDLNTTPGFGSVSDRLDPQSGTQFVTLTADDDCMRFTYALAPSGTVTVLSGSPADTSSSKKVDLSFPLGPGEKKVLTLTPYDAVTGGVAGPTAIYEYSRAPQTTAAIEPRAEDGGLSTERVKVTLRCLPTIQDVGGDAAVVSAGTGTITTTGYSVAAGAFQTVGQNVYYMRVVAGKGKGAVVRVVTNAATSGGQTQFTVSGTWLTPSGGVVTPDATSSVRIQKGATLIYHNTTPSVSLDDFWPVCEPEFIARGTTGFYLEYYSQVYGCPAESPKRTFVDANNRASLKGGSVTPSQGISLNYDATAQVLTVAAVEPDDDVSYVEFYAKRAATVGNNYPTTNGLATGSLNADYYRFEGSLPNNLSFPMTTTGGVWHIIAVPYNAYNEEGDRAYATIDISTAVVQPALSNLQVNPADVSLTPYNRISWDHNSAVVAAHRVIIRAYRQDLGSGSVVTLVSAGDARAAWADAGTGSSTAGSYDHLVQVSGVTQQRGTAATYTWMYTIELRDSANANALVGTYYTSHTGGWASLAPTLNSCAIANINPGNKSGVNGFCTASHVNRVIWNVSNPNDTDYRIDIDVAYDSAGTSFSPLITGALTTESYYDHVQDGFYEKSGGPTTMYWKYKAKLVRKSDGSVVASQISTQRAAQIDGCTIPQDL